MGWTIKVEFHLYINKVEKETTEREKHEAETTTDDFLSLAEVEISRQQSFRSKSTIENYRTALRSFGRYLQRKAGSKDIDAEMMAGYERWLAEHDVSHNTISCYMRSLRSLVAKIYGEDRRNIFKTVFTGKEKTDKRAIQEHDLMRLRALKLKAGSFLCLARDLFLFSFYALGMPFVDMAFLRKQQISDNQIVYYRHKTGQRVCVPIEPCMLEIIRRYERPDSDYVFPLLKSAEPQKAYDEYLSMLRRYNTALKRLGQMVEAKRKLTSYVSRYTWASMAYSANVGLPVISKALGHANPQTTLTYIQQINDSRLVEASRQVLRLLRK